MSADITKAIHVCSAHSPLILQVVASKAFLRQLTKTITRAESCEKKIVKIVVVIIVLIILTTKVTIITVMKMMMLVVMTVAVVKLMVTIMTTVMTQHLLQQPISPIGHRSS